MKDEYIGTAIAAKELGYTPKTIERYIKAGKIRAKRHGRHYKILRSDWETYKKRTLKDIADVA